MQTIVVVEMDLNRLGELIQIERLGNPKYADRAREQQVVGVHISLDVEPLSELPVEVLGRGLPLGDLKRRLWKPLCGRLVVVEVCIPGGGEAVVFSVDDQPDICSGFGWVPKNPSDLLNEGTLAWQWAEECHRPEVRRVDPLRQLELMHPVPF
jgi:hypothetical protein